MGWQPSYQSEGRIYAKYLLKEKPDAKIAVHVPERRFRQGLSQGPQGRPRRQGASMIVAEESYESVGADHRHPHRQAEGLPAPTSSSASRRRNSPRRAIKKVAEIGWKPLHIQRQRRRFGRPRAASPRASKMRKAFSRPPTPRTAPTAVGQRRRHEEVLRVPRQIRSRRQQGRRLRRVRLRRRPRPWCKVLKQCGDNLTRENIMKQAASLKDFAPDTLLPGVKINTSADRLLSDRAASDDAVQGREVGPVRPTSSAAKSAAKLRPAGLDSKPSV